MTATVHETPPYRTPSDRPRLRYLHDRTDRDAFLAERCEHIVDRLGRPIEDCRWSDVARAIYAQAGKQPDEDGQFMARTAWSSVEGVFLLAGLVNSSIMAGMDAAADVTEGWTARSSLPNFLAAQVGVLDETPRPDVVPRGSTAPAMRFSTTAEGFVLSRFGLQWTLDEQDLADSETIGLRLLALQEAGRAFKRLIGDLVFAAILKNPTLQDGTAAFAVARGNLGTATLGTTGLDDGATFIGNSTSADTIPVHLGLQPKYLIVPAGNLVTAQGLLQSLRTNGDTDMILRCDSRLGPTGVYDPTDESLYQGTENVWLLAAPASQRPCIVVAARNGKFTPTIRHFEQRHGEWGQSYDACLDLAVGIVDYRGLYLSTGVGG